MLVESCRTLVQTVGVCLLMLVDTPACSLVVAGSVEGRRRRPGLRSWVAAGFFWVAVGICFQVLPFFAASLELQWPSVGGLGRPPLPLLQVLRLTKSPHQCAPSLLLQVLLFLDPRWLGRCWWLLQEVPGSFDD